MNAPRVAVGGIAQETNSFTGIPTTMADFIGRGGEYTVADAVVAEHRGVNSIVGGFLDDLEGVGATVLPLVHARACPGGPLDRPTYEALRDDLLARLEALGDGYDAVLLALHGAMVAEGYDDPEGDLLARVRALAGDRPVGVVLDLHANVTPEIVAAADVLVAFKTYPHVDMAACGRTAAAATRRAVVDGRASVASAFVPLPMMLPSIRMRTIDPDGPMTRVEALAAERMAADPELVEVGLYGGFPYADVPFDRACVVVNSRRGTEHAHAVANDVASAFWDARHEFLATLEPATRAVERALRAERHPVVLADVADNPGSGGTGDTPTLLRLLVERDVDRSFVGILFDPESVEAAFAAGEGARTRFALGGNVNAHHGAPVAVEALVERLSDGHYTCVGPMMHGKRESLGRSALLRVGNVLVGISEGRASVNDPAMLTMLGVDVADFRVLALKVKGHFRAAFGPLVADVIDAEAPGASMTDFSGLPYRQRATPAFPLEPDTSWRP